MVAPPPAAGGGSQTAFTYSSEPQAVPPKRNSVRSKYREDAATTPAAAQWMDENDVSVRINQVLATRLVLSIEKSFRRAGNLSQGPTISCFHGMCCTGQRRRYRHHAWYGAVGGRRAMCIHDSNSLSDAKGFAGGTCH